MRLLVTVSAMLAVAAPGQSAVMPPAPAVAAETSIKNIRLHWEGSAGASWYEVWYRPNAAGTYRRVLADIPASRTEAEFRISVHLLDWAGARYQVAACNRTGCTRSAPVSVSGLREAASGNFKAAVPMDAGYLGDDVDLSPGGTSFVAAQPNYFDWLEGYNEDDDGIGAALVFRRNGDGTWLERAKLRPALQQVNGGRDMRVAISANGNRVVMGLPGATHAAGDPNTGEVYVFTGSGAAWNRTRIPTVAGGRFGAWVGINDAGDVVAVRGNRGVSLYRLAGGAWTRVRTLNDSSARIESCPRGLLTRDGGAVVESCYTGASAQSPATQYVRIHSGTGWSAREEIDLAFPAGRTADLRCAIGADRGGNVVAAQSFDGALNVKLFRRRAGVLELETTQYAGEWQAQFPGYSTYGESIAVSGDGKLLAVGDTRDLAEGFGVLTPPISLREGDPGGAVYVYQHSAGSWALRSLVRAGYPYGWDGNSASTFGQDVALCASGATLLVGQPRESSGGQGIDSWQFSALGWPFNGAAFLY